MNAIHSILKLDNLFIGYTSGTLKKHQKVFGPMNMEISQPELIGIIGRNGIGKSTLLRTICGLQPALDGCVYIQGGDGRHIPKSIMARLISFVSTDPVRVANLRVNELVTMGRFPYTNWFGKLTAEDRQMIGEAVEHTGIKELLFKSVHQLSDGERQKVMIARALVQDTPVIILDEPTAFLDLQARHEVLRLLSNLSRHHQKLILFSTHDLSIAMDEVDKLWLMTDEGMFEGAPEDLLMNQVFRKLFHNSAIEFDQKSMAFKYRRKYTGSIIIRAEEPFSSMARNAMDRAGIETVVNGSADFTLTLNISNETPVWVLTGNNIHSVFPTLYDLVAFINSLRT
jgi:iron complex transport system ATP-binding protein